MYFLLNIGIFQCHVTFQGCIKEEKAGALFKLHLLDPEKEHIDVV